MTNVQSGKKSGDAKATSIVDALPASGQDSPDAKNRYREDSAHRVRIATSALVLWLAQPPFAWWPLAFLALVPWLDQISRDANIQLSKQQRRRRYLFLWLAATCYWLVSLQGLRHAHPAMFLCWMALSGYLAIYPVFFLIATQAWLRRGIPLLISAPVLWVGIECIRNYMLTGISAAMLGHTLANVPLLTQVADLGGTYAVSLVIVAVNVAFAQWLGVATRSEAKRPAIVSALAAALLVVSSCAYGNLRLNEVVPPGTTSFLVVGRNETVEYDQDADRAEEIFTAFAQQTINDAEQQHKLDAVVWPESMFSGGVPWYIAEPGGTVPEGMRVDEYQRYFEERALALGQAVAEKVPQQQSPHLIVGCGVVRFAQAPLVYSAIVHTDPNGHVVDWYGKNHLVMFGEYIPVITWIPGIKSLVPPGLGVQPGNGPNVFQINDTRVMGNICIETAVERVAVDHCRALRTSGGMPDAIVTVTNDGWFDGTSVVEHHLRCAQLVAIGCRRPILSAANGGPTAWIDSSGRIVEKLAFTDNGSIVATPQIDSRVSLYVRIGDWPARFAGLACLLTLGAVFVQGRRSRGIDET
jgi:apolipoprotein N-acyltransferase